MEKELAAPKWVLALGALIVWFAIIVQFLLMMQHTTVSTGESITRFFLFFTILTNILTAICYSILLLLPSSATAHFFSQRAIQTALVVYITVVGIIYNAVLRSLNMPTGMDKLVNELLHVFSPLYFLFFWFLFVPKSKVPYDSIFRWAFYPLLYLVAVLIHGYSSGWYPYPFVNVQVHGYPIVLRNCAMLFAAFFLLSAFFVWVGRMKRGTTAI